MHFDLSLAIASLPALFHGLMMTICLSIFVLLLGIVFSVPMALARMSKRRSLAWPALVFVIFFRGTPVLVLLYILYFGIAQFAWVRESFFWPLFADPFGCAVIGLALNHVAYMTDVVRGSLLSVPRGIAEASLALGIPERKVFLWVRLPLALRYGIRAYQNEVVGFIKGTAIVSVVTINDLTAVANGIFQETYDPLTPMITAAVMYWIVVNLVRLGFAGLDRWLNRHHAPEPASRTRTRKAAVA
ncbi:ABC transporter permease subunit [Pseudooceanicola sp. CBS1P-1]|uniref:ABC transporter permease subunit n=1 Tax=Pseudooceanicola albus TaxID=2692189 RepID=A0A6L7GAK0_9RHOB|nr:MULTISPECIES: ABC transporter permease subunit [Pseudooceanicola]MBT9386586.1 ABC transporter permease subunit [Pseudooceanicola endophyticus]MXN20702.1 ABC transporter permease subunit [Pseudooceanicola albus]